MSTPLAPPPAPVLTPETRGPMPPSARPTGVAILAIVAFVAAGLAVLAALGSFAFGTLLGSLAGSRGAMFGGALGAFFGFFFLVGAVLSGFTGFGLWTGQSWGRILGIVWGGLWALGGLGSLAGRSGGGFVTLVLGGVILWYLFQPGVKRWFER